MINDSYHIPVLLQESIDALDIKPDGIYVDVTFGGGGHSSFILKQLGKAGRLYGFDQDPDAVSNAIQDPRFTMVQANFRFLTQFMRYYNIDKVDGILADLGVSSFHFDMPERGFSYRFEAELDMRMNQSTVLTAAQVLHKYSAEQLQNIFSNYGEVRNSKTLSRAIVDGRQRKKIKMTSDLMSVIQDVYRGDLQKYASQVFQALRIEVNDEMGVLEDFLDNGLKLLNAGGRMVVISYHSLEDKLVKQYLRSSSGKPQIEYDEYGRTIEKYKPVSKKPIMPTEIEIEKNSRAASAKLRATEKL